LRAQETADARAGLAGDDEAFPARNRGLRPRGDDLDLIAVLQLGPQRQHAAVDLGADAMVADLRVDGVGEVDRRRALRQLDQVALGREAEHLVLEQLQLGVLQELLRFLGVVDDVDQLAQPAELLALGHLLALLVGPVRRQTQFRPLVHLVGADLNLDAALLRADHAGVQCRIAVQFGGGDVVLKTTGITG